jgi:hypothetical protein
VLLERLEGTLLGLVAGAGQVLQGLLAGGVLLLAHNAAVLVLHQILAGKTAGCVLGRAVVDLEFAASGNHSATHHRLVVHGFLTKEDIFFGQGQWPAGHFALQHFVI